MRFLILTAVLCFLAGALFAQVPTVPSNAKWFSNLDDASGWIACSACADWGVTSNYWYKQGVTSPSKDGKSMVINKTVPAAWVSYSKQYLVQIEQDTDLNIISTTSA